jgi:hypothetical protein
LAFLKNQSFNQNNWAWTVLSLHGPQRQKVLKYDRERGSEREREWNPTGIRRNALNWVHLKHLIAVGLES